MAQSMRTFIHQYDFALQELIFYQSRLLDF